MPYSLDELAKDIKGVLEDHGIQEGSDKVCYYVQKALMDQNFIHNNLKDRDDENSNPREILYEDSDKKRLIWVERGRSPLIYSFLWHDYEVEPIAYIARELDHAGIQYFNIPYYEPYGSSNLYEGLRGEVLTIHGRRSEGIINKSDIVIFDTCGPTMLHYCLEYEIAFLLVLNESSVERFTSKQKEWFNILSDNQLAFLDNEVGKLSSSIKNIMSEEYDIPAEVRIYHEQQFIRI